MLAHTEAVSPLTLISSSLNNVLEFGKITSTSATFFAPACVIVAVSYFKQYVNTEKQGMERLQGNKYHLISKYTNIIEYKVDINTLVQTMNVIPEHSDRKQLKCC